MSSDMTPIEYALILVALVALGFTAGWFSGRGNNQALSLVRRLRLNVLATTNEADEPDWYVCYGANRKEEATDTDLTRAIVACAAKVQASKGEAK